MGLTIPLCAYTSQGRIKIFRNQNFELVRLPFKPFIYSKFDVNQKEIYNYEIIEEERILLSTKKLTKIYKYIFSSLRDYYNFQKRYYDTLLYEKNVVSNIFTIEEDFFLNYPQQTDLRILDFDIECRTIGDGLMADPLKHEILAIGCSFIEGEKQTYQVFTTEDCNEAEMLVKFKHAFNKFNPDILTGFNIKRFDIPYIVTRLRMLGLDEYFLHRDKAEPVDLTEATKERWGGNHTDINVKLELHGRIVYDLYVQCGRDNKLRKLRNLKLTTISTFFGIEDISLDKSVMKNLNKWVKDGHWPDLKKYLRNDVYQTEEILKIYLPGRLDVAEILKVPLQYILNDYPAFVPDVAISRAMWKENFLGDKSNIDRYPEILTWEGATVKFNPINAGMHKPVRHADFSSMYPNIIMSYNLSPETITLVEIRTDIYQFKVIDLGDKLEIWLPDKKIKPDIPATIIIHVDKKDGILRKMLLPIYNERLKYKKLYRQSIEEGNKNDKLNSLQNIYKLILNTTYGYNGAKFCKWGDLLVAIATTAIGRHLVEKVKDYLGEENWIEIDTDGIWCKNLQKSDMPKLNEWLNNLVMNEHHCSFSQMKLDYEEEEIGYFYKMKNYIIRSNDKLEFTGCSFVNRKMPMFIQKSYEKIIHQIFDGKSEVEVVNDFLNFDKYELSEFAMNTKLSKHISEYKGDGSMNKKLISQLNDLKIEVSFGMQISFYKTTNGYEIEELVKDKKDLDYAYYATHAEKVLERLNLLKSKKLKKQITELTRLKTDPKSMSLNNWIGENK